MSWSVMTAYSHLTIAIGKVLKLSPPFPPLHTGHATFIAPGVPSNQLTTLHRGSTLYALTVHIVLTNFTYFCTSESSLIPFRLYSAVLGRCWPFGNSHYIAIWDFALYSPFLTEVPFWCDNKTSYHLKTAVSYSIYIFPYPCYTHIPCSWNIQNWTLSLHRPIAVYLLRYLPTVCRMEVACSCYGNCCRFACLLPYRVSCAGHRACFHICYA